MKKIQVANNEFYYKVFLMNGTPSTKFYYLSEIKQRKKYYFIGPLIEVPIYIAVFEIPQFNIESCYISRAEANRRVLQNIDLFNRSVEIKKGFLI